ncbi:MAG: NapC/NirT family cytochrome c [ANME-2 cluster archaeon]|nr:NapC/NirT family cytochrome c [ANME-2 cluster archaeon]
MTNKISTKLVFLVLVISLLVPSAAVAEGYVIGDQKMPVERSEGQEDATYVGAEECKVCHSDKYNDWVTTGHNYKLSTPDEILAVRPDLPMPEGYSKEDILYVIGGWGWKARFIGTDGYIITKTGENRDIDGKNQYNIATGEWVDYNAGKEKKYDCTKCHNTGSSYESDQDNLPGMVGSWEFRGIQCEACHGPGSEHVARRGGKGVAIVVNREASMCGQCHRRGADDDKIPAKGKFVQHHEQYLDFLSSGKMSALNCVDCHDPHQPVHVGATNTEAGKGIISTCEECHQTEEAGYNGTVMQLEGVECIDCHMPRAALSAAPASEYVGDVRSHLFRINISADAEYIYTDPADNMQYANPALTVEYVCLPCHEEMDKAWAAEHAPEAMTLMPEAKTPMEDATKPSPGFGILVTSTVLVAIYLLKRR